MDFRRILRALGEIGFAGLSVLEIISAALLEGFAASLEALAA